MKTLSLVLSIGLTLSAAAQSLVPNGDFERADAKDASKPLFWQKPDGLGVKWETAPSDGSQAHGKAISMNTAISEKEMVEQWEKKGMTEWVFPKAAGNAIAETYGLSYYSDAIPVKSGQVYRVSFDYKGPSGGGKVWVRGWGMHAGEKRRRYEAIVFCRTKGEGWTHFEQDFEPTKHRPEVTEMKVMLYAYYPAGVYWFDNVKIVAITGTASTPARE